MSIAEIKRTKSDLIAWIEQLSDPGMLFILDGLRTSKTGGDWWADLSESQRQHIEEGLADAENGRAISSDIFWNKLRNA